MARDTKDAFHPRTVQPIVACLIVLAVAWAAVLLVDTGLVGGRDNSDKWPVWYQLFREAGFIEWIQWAVLGAMSVAAGVASGHARSRGRNDAAGLWLLVAIGGAILAIEDAGQISHSLRHYYFSFTGTDTASARLPVWCAIVVFWVYAMVRYRRQVLAYTNVRFVLASGFVAYGVAAFTSVPSNRLFSFYPRAGEFVIETVFGGRLARLPFPIWGAETDNSGYVLMDLLFEESLELIAAGLLLTAVVRGLATEIELPQSAVDAPGRGRGGG